MAYNLRQIFEDMEARLSEDPALTLSRFSRDLDIDRHTVEAAVRMCRGICFRDYKQRKQLERTYGLLTGKPKITGNKIAKTLGYRSTAAFLRFLKTKTGKSLTQIKKEARQE